MLLGELRNELVDSIRQLKVSRNAYEQILRSETRAVYFLDSGVDCRNECWPVIVDFFHASQWLNISVTRTTFDEMRRNGWPRNRQIVDSVEAYHRQTYMISGPLMQLPAYRTLVRSLIPLEMRSSY